MSGDVGFTRHPKLASASSAAIRGPPTRRAAGNPRRNCAGRPRRTTLTPFIVSTSGADQPGEGYRRSLPPNGRLQGQRVLLRRHVEALRLRIQRAAASVDRLSDAREGTETIGEIR